MKRTLTAVIVVIFLLGGGIIFLSNKNGGQPAVSAENSNVPSATDAVPTISPNAVASTPVPAGYTLAQVALHKSASSCWTVINGKVYDLTNWVNQHPGGPQAILSICGVDGSAAFNNQHGGQSRPANELAGFEIGPLVSKASVSGGTSGTGSATSPAGQNTTQPPATQTVPSRYYDD